MGRLQPHTHESPLGVWEIRIDKKATSKKIATLGRKASGLMPGGGLGPALLHPPWPRRAQAAVGQDGARGWAGTQRRGLQPPGCGMQPGEAG